MRKGLVLAAGLGNRLRPLTDIVPKPLVPFLGSTPLELALWRMKQSGIDAVAVNAHHLHAQIEAYVTGNPFKQTLHLSLEPEILGTGGAYNPLRSWQGDCDLLVINGDLITDCDLDAVFRRHQESKAVATMLLLPKPLPGQTAVYHADGEVRAIQNETVPGTQAGNFACVQVLSRQFIELMPAAGAFDIINHGYRVALARGLRIACLVHDGIWHDLGTPATYWAALMQSLDLPEVRDRLGLSACHAYKGIAPKFVKTPDAGRHSFVSEQADIADAAIGPHAIIEASVTLGRGTKVSQALLMPGAKLADGVHVTRMIVGPGLKLPL